VNVRIRPGASCLVLSVSRYISIRNNNCRGTAAGRYFETVPKLILSDADRLDGVKRLLHYTWYRHAQQQQQHASWTRCRSIYDQFSAVLFHVHRRTARARPAPVAVNPARQRTTRLVGRRCDGRLKQHGLCEVGARPPTMQTETGNIKGERSPVIDAAITAAIVRGVRHVTQLAVGSRAPPTDRPTARSVVHTLPWRSPRLGDGAKLHRPEHCTTATGREEA
jgi:hypothetical protein